MHPNLPDFQKRISQVLSRKTVSLLISKTSFSSEKNLSKTERCPFASARSSLPVPKWWIIYIFRDIRIDKCRTWETHTKLYYSANIITELERCTYIHIFYFLPSNKTILDFFLLHLPPNFRICISYTLYPNSHKMLKNMRKRRTNGQRSLFIIVLLMHAFLSCFSYPNLSFLCTKYFFLLFSSTLLFGMILALSKGMMKRWTQVFFMCVIRSKRFLH